MTVFDMDSTPAGEAWDCHAHLFGPYARYPLAAEGDMSRRLADLVRKETCAEVAIAWNLGAFMRLGETVFDEAGRMKPSSYYDRVVDVMEELAKFTLLTRDVSPYLVDRYSERRESAEALSKRVNQRTL